MAGKRANIPIGERFGRLIVLDRRENKKGPHVLCSCRCDCGTEIITRLNRLISGDTKSCGCLKRELARSMVKKGLNRTHGLYGTGAHTTWSQMIQRCKNKNNPAYKDYGGRGISICKEWEKFENFHNDMGDRPIGLELDRRNNDGNYEPNNCRWVTPKINARNRRTTILSMEKAVLIRKEAKKTGITHKKLAKRYGVSKSTIAKITCGDQWV